MPDAIIEKIGDPPSPISLFKTIAPYPYTFFLDSALQDKQLGRFSFLGCEPFLVFKSKGDRIFLEWADGEAESFRANPFSALKEIFKKYKCGNQCRQVPFISGGVGYFSYDMKNFVEDLPDIAIDDLGIPDCMMGFYDVVIAYDHLEETAYIASCGLPHSGAKRARRQRDRLAEFKARIKKRTPGQAYLSGPVPGRLRSNFSRSGYIDAIEKAKLYIKKGDIYQVNLSQRFQTDLNMDPSNLYSKLRAISPAPFASYLGFKDVTILSSSPERFLLKNGRYIETRPIKGTRPRGADNEMDLLLERELIDSVKDNAEHIMIVDLERNDLGKICDYGSIMPAGPAIVERYSNVFHLVSTVSGRLKESTDSVDCLLAAFPGGSITGAPKVRAMEIIEELEPVRRSIYTGAIGYISFDGEMDTSIAIRTLIVKDGKAYFSVGGGIVADSDPGAEYQETLDKAKGIMLALGLSGSQGKKEMIACER